MRLVSLRIAPILFLACAWLTPTVTAADVITVDTAGAVTVAGAAPATPAAGEVRLGSGQIKAGGTVTAGDVLVNRSEQASGAQAVRGDDPRMSDARVANGGNADTVQNMAPGVANGVATLDAAGKVPATQLPAARDVAYFITTGTFTVPAGVSRVFVKVWGGGAHGSAGGPGGGSGGLGVGRIDVTPGQIFAVTVGGPGQASGFGGVVTADGGSSTQGGTAVGNIFQMPGAAAHEKHGGSAPMGGAGGGGGSNGNPPQQTSGAHGGFPGGGGGGGGRNAGSGPSASTKPGGTGAPGCVIVEW